jgi:hypothetical protein
MWSTVQIGKHQGKTIPQIILSDPDYFFWAIEQDNFFRGRLATEARDSRSKIRRIKIPKSNPHDWLIEYWWAHDGKFARFDIIESNRPPHAGSSFTLRKRHLDFAVVRESKHYDKLGYRLFLDSFKYHFLGKTSARITKAVAEKFFDTPSNFV